MSRSLRRFSSFLILQVLCFAVAGAQIWAGEAVVRGVVTDIDGHPIAGAQVALALVDQPGAGPRTVKTDNQGRWRIGGIAEGRWDLVIEARGFVSVEGWVQSAGRYSEPVEVWMRPLDEVTAGFAESSSSIRCGGWRRPTRCWNRVTMTRRARNTRRPWERYPGLRSRRS